MTVTLTVINDFPVLVAGVQALLGPYADRVTVVPGQSTLEVAEPVDVALFDIFSSGPGWQDRCTDHASDPRIGAVVIYSFITDPRAVKAALAAGAQGFLTKSLVGEDLVVGLERIAAGEQVVLLGEDEEPGPASPWPAGSAGLSPREAEMLALIAQGWSNEDIALACYLSINTVKSYIRDAYRKIGVATRPQAVAWAMQNGLEPSR
ncbi:response regulator transcription factor [Dietzia sp. ANT_WB102]|uniref:response regulator transcription factor n=1 Tax=Dietzia sp. ANT_WB102 TaxID=2597345 RepID=UPI0011EF755A|nr:response regulator transcription factor [Dietzia sp. ANT_WB102]KAA0917892.1 response regulator transcription factor [Dietzia sp. ANT_WB102]